MMTGDDAFLRLKMRQEKCSRHFIEKESDEQALHFSGALMDLASTTCAEWHARFSLAKPEKTRAFIARCKIEACEEVLTARDGYRYERQDIYLDEFSYDMSQSTLSREDFYLGETRIRCCDPGAMSDVSLIETMKDELLHRFALKMKNYQENTDVLASSATTDDQDYISAEAVCFL